MPRRTRTSSAPAAARAADFSWRTFAAAAEQTIDWPYGCGAVTPSLPRVWDRNLLRIERAPRVAAAARVTAAAEAALARFGLPHRKLVCDDADVALRLSAGLVGGGWREEGLAVLAWPPGRALPAPPVSARADECDWEDVRDLFATTRTDGDDPDFETVRQLTAAAARTPRSRMFAAAFGPGEEPAALCRLWTDGRTAEVDDVNTLTSARRRGLGLAVLRAALATALEEGCDLVFLRAHESDWPRRWYDRLGFEPIGHQHAWIRAARS